jgi:cobalt-zinc-cadmium efflux system membrane fusion protein
MKYPVCLIVVISLFSWYEMGLAQHSCGHDHHEHDPAPAVESPAVERIADDHEEHMHEQQESLEVDHESHGAGCEHEEHNHGADVHDAHSADVVVPIPLQHELEIEVGHPQSGVLVKERTFPGRIVVHPDRVSRVSSRYDGTLETVKRSYGDAVRKGDVLAEIQHNETLARFSVKAPRNGLITSRDARVGEHVDAGDPLFVITDYSVVRLEADVYADYIHSLHNGDTVLVVRNDESECPAKVQYVSADLDPVKRTGLLLADLDNDDGRWYPGLFVRAKAVVSEVRAEVTVPADAVQMLDGIPVVFVREDAQTFTPAEVQIGMRDHRRVEVRSGLQRSDEVVVRGAYKLKSQILTSGIDPHAGHGH